MYTSSTPGQTHRNYDHIPTHLYCTSCTSQVFRTLQEIIRLVTLDLEFPASSKNNNDRKIYQLFCVAIVQKAGSFVQLQELMSQDWSHAANIKTHVCLRDEGKEKPFC